MSTTIIQQPNRHFQISIRSLKSWSQRIFRRKLMRVLSNVDRLVALVESTEDLTVHRRQSPSVGITVICVEKEVDPIGVIHLGFTGIRRNARFE